MTGQKCIAGQHSIEVQFVNAPRLQQFRFSRLISVTRPQNLRPRTIQIERHAIRRDIHQPHPQIKIRHIRRDKNLRMNRPGHFHIRSQWFGVEHKHIVAGVSLLGTVPANAANNG